MMNVNKYTKGYFMPPVVDMNWAKKNIQIKHQFGAV